MGLLQTLKPFWPLLLTLILPRALSFARTVNVAFRTRPQSTPLPSKARNALNILFLSVVVWFALSVKPGSLGTDNVFVTSLSRLALPSDALFARLAMARGESGLSALDEGLRGKLTTRAGRELYLRFGTETMVNCRFCSVQDELSNVLFHSPTNVLLPHLAHLGVLGVAMSEGISGFDVSRWRARALLGALGMVLVDLYMLLGFEYVVDVNGPAPIGLFWIMRVMRPLVLCVFDGVVAGVVWASATNRLVMFGEPAMDEEGVKRKNTEMLNSSLMSLQTAQTKLRAANVARNAVVRDRVLKQVEDVYWRDVNDVEAREGLGGGTGMEGVWEDEDVQAAMARAYGQGAIDVRRMRGEAEGFVRAVTGHLDGNGPG